MNRFYAKPRRVIKSKPSRKTLLKVIGDLQGYIGAIQSRYGDDISPDRYSKVMDNCGEAFDLCVDARSFDDC